MIRYFDAPGERLMISPGEYRRIRDLARPFSDSDRAENLLHGIHGDLLCAIPPNLRGRYLDKLRNVQQTAIQYGPNEDTPALALYENALTGAYRIVDGGRRVQIVTSRPVHEIIGTVGNTVTAMNPAFRSLAQFQKLLHNAFDSSPSEFRSSTPTGHKAIHVRGSRPGETIVIGRDISPREFYGF